MKAHPGRPQAGLGTDGVNRTHRLKGGGAALVLVIAAMGQTAAFGVERQTRVEVAPIAIAWDASCPVVGDHAVIPWRWTKRSGLKPSDRLSIEYRPYRQGPWKTIASGVRLDHDRRTRRLEGRYVWDASQVNPGRIERYEARLVVGARHVVSAPYAFWIDHVPPRISIAEPAAIVEVPGPDGRPVAASFARGWTELRASVLGERRFCHKVLWTVQDPVWTTTSTADRVYFNDVMSYRIWATAIDRAGNRTTTEPLHILALPGNERTWQLPVSICAPSPPVCTPKDTGAKLPA